MRIDRSRPAPGNLRAFARSAKGLSQRRTRPRSWRFGLGWPWMATVSQAARLGGSWDVPCLAWRAWLPVHGYWSLVGCCISGLAGKQSVGLGRRGNWLTGPIPPQRIRLVPVTPGLTGGVAVLSARGYPRDSMYLESPGARARTTHQQQRARRRSACGCVVLWLLEDPRAASTAGSHSAAMDRPI